VKPPEPTADTRRRILDAALACFLEDGYERTPVARIRARSGTSNGALFHHFASKEAVAEALYVEAIASFQEGLRELLRHRPPSLQAGLRDAIAHQLRWTEEHPDRARFLYLRGHLEWDTPGGRELAGLNRELAGAMRSWMAPFAERGEVRPTTTLMITAIVGGPVHAIARRWLAGQVRAPLMSFLDELADAAHAALRGTGVPARPAPAPDLRCQVTVELVGEDGAVVGRLRASAPLDADGATIA
jgi:AcrR family transcriptional regulator